MKMIRFPFTAPLQSWGEDARWDTRSTALQPTKSGIIGYLGCCLGYPRGDERLNCLNRDLRVAVRADRPGQILTDYQTVQGSDGGILAANGKKRKNGDIIVTPKQYLQYAWFTVFLQGEEGLLEECYTAMVHPKWTPYLGRKNCVPSVPVKPEWVAADTLEDAVSVFSDEDLKHSEPNVIVEMDFTVDADLAPDERTYNRIDNLVHAQKNEYASRLVKSYTIQSGGEQL